MGQRIYLNRQWTFKKVFDIQGKPVNEKEVIVDLPHSFSETTFHYFNEEEYQYIGEYRKTIVAKKEWQGKVLNLICYGSAHCTEVFVNDKKVKVHQCGYTAFMIDIAPHLKWEQENEIRFLVDSRESNNVPPFGKVIDYMTYGGIYRDVVLEVLEQTHIQDVFAYTSRVLDKEKVLHIKVQATKCFKEAKYKFELKEHNGDLVASMEEEFKEQVNVDWMLEQVKIWDLDTPILYDLVCTIIEKDQCIDQKSITIGFRQAEFKEDGFFLNGHKVKLRGLNRHQSYPYVGYAMPESMQKLDAEILKNELGLNAVRTSHYPQSQYFLNRCDELGLLVFTEIPGWQYIGDEQWQQVAIQNVRDMVLQNRNHPSIILWGVRINESRDLDSFYEQTNEAAKHFDPTRATGGVRCIADSHLLEDVYTYNDFIHEGYNQGIANRDQITKEKKHAYLVSEYNGHMFPTKPWDWEEKRVEHCLRHSKVLEDIAKQDRVAGGFGWCMFDYNTHKEFGSGDRICYHGVLDQFRNFKDAAYVYASQQEKTPILHIPSTMDIGEHPASVVGKLYAFSNADSVKMYKNEKFIKEYPCQVNNGVRMPIWLNDYFGDLLQEQEGYSDGKAKIVKELLMDAAFYGMGHISTKNKVKFAFAYVRYGFTFKEGKRLYSKYIGNWGDLGIDYRFEGIRNGQVVSEVKKESVTKVSLELNVSHMNLVEKHSYDVASIRIVAKDQNNNQIPFANEVVTFETSGAIELIGPKQIALQGGMGGTYVKSLAQDKKSQGTLTVLRANGESETLQFTIEKRD